MSKVDPQRSLPGTYVREFVDLCGRFDVTPSELLSGTSVDYAALTDPATRISLDTLTRIGRRAVVLTGEPGIAFYMGLHMRISWHGFLGFAAMTASTVREALMLAERYAATKTGALSLHVVEDEATDTASLLLEERVPLAVDVREFLVVALFSGLKVLGEALVGGPFRADIDMAFPEPSYIEKFRAFVPGEIRFDRPVSRATFARSFLDRPIVSADPIAMQLARDQCERELAAIGPSLGIVDQVRKLARPVDGSMPGIDEVAQRLHVSTRTLKRRLAERETTFSEIAENVRHNEALILLGDPRLAIDDVAAKLGYSDTANFARAFRRWTGTTPGAYRTRAKG